MNDLISRQAAIDALGEKPLAWTEGEYELGLQWQWESDTEAIKTLPSAEPEIVRCKDCKWRYETEHNNKRYMVCDFMDCRMKDDDFCSRAERRTDE